MGDDLDALVAMATSAAIGLLVGLERERNPLTKAGLRTFALIALLGTLATTLAQAIASGWIVAAGLLVVGGSIAGASFADPRTKEDDSGTTTIVAAMVVFALGCLIALGHRQLAVALGVAVTVLLYFKTELEGFSHKLTPQDLQSMLRFAVLSAVILPLLPDRALAQSGPLAALNPHHVWLMVVLISAVSLAGYVAWRLTLGRHGLLVTGILGGLASSTATTLVAARHARDGSQAPSQAQVVILLANVAMLVRVILLVALVAPALAPAAAKVIVPMLILALPAFAWHWRRAAGASDEGEGGYRNPTNLATAFGFAAAFALVMVLAAWATDHLGTGGLFAVAAISGLTDVDAITLSTLRLQATGALIAGPAVTAIGIAVGANLLMKTAVVVFVGGREMGAGTALAFLLPFAALVAALLLD